eukprot:scaffold231771_cov31-Tisochrysis_lutea.AAC.3
MRALFQECCRGFGTGIKFGEVLRGVLTLVREHGVSIDANYMTLVTNVSSTFCPNRDTSGERIGLDATVHAHYLAT